jgi:hypothetical protein
MFGRDGVEESTYLISSIFNWTALIQEIVLQETIQIFYFLSASDIRHNKRDGL